MADPMKQHKPAATATGWRAKYTDIYTPVLFNSYRHINTSIEIQFKS